MEKFEKKKFFSFCLKIWLYTTKSSKTAKKKKKKHTHKKKNTHTKKIPIFFNQIYIFTWAQTCF